MSDVFRFSKTFSISSRVGIYIRKYAILISHDSENDQIVPHHQVSMDYSLAGE